MMNKVCYYCGMFNVGENMKVITEERLKQILRTMPGNIEGRVLLESLLDQLIEDECQEIDTLTVSKLRQMCDAVSDPDKRYKKFLFKRIGLDGLDQGQFDTSGNVWMNGNVYYPDELEGWAEFPIYKPEKE